MYEGTACRTFELAFWLGSEKRQQIVTAQKEFGAFQNSIKAGIL